MRESNKSRTFPQGIDPVERINKIRPFIPAARPQGIRGKVRDKRMDNIRVNDRIVFFGTPDFSARALSELFKNDCNIIAIITKPFQEAGLNKELRESPMKSVALKKGVPIFEPQDLVSIVSELKSLQPTAGILFAYGKIIPAQVLKVFPKGIVNIHPSLLPKYRGPSPVQAAILHGDAKTGVSIMVLDDKLDRGPILAQKIVSIGKAERLDQLHDRLAKVGTSLLIKVLPDYLNNTLIPKKQVESESSFTKHIERKDGMIDWSKSAQEIFNQFRAFYPWPGVFSYWGKKRVKITNLMPSRDSQKPTSIPGMVFLRKDALYVSCHDTSIIIQSLQLEGKKNMPSHKFILGYRTFVGSRLTSKLNERFVS